MIHRWARRGNVRRKPPRVHREKRDGHQSDQSENNRKYLTHIPSLQKSISNTLRRGQAACTPQFSSAWLSRHASLVDTSRTATLHGNLVRQCFEREICGLGLAGSHSDVLRLRAILFVPCRQRVLPRRKSLEAERTILASYRIMRRAQYNEIAVHPRMNVALHRNEFRFVILRVDGRRSGRLRLVPFRIYFREWMDVMRCLIVVEDLQNLARLHRQDVRKILAALLVVSDNFGGRCARRVACRNVDDNEL